MKKKAFIWALAIIVAAININAQQRFTIKGELPDSLDGIPLIILFSPDGTILAYNLREETIMKAVEEALAE